MQNVCVTAGP